MLADIAIGGLHWIATQFKRNLNKWESYDLLPHNWFGVYYVVIYSWLWLLFVRVVAKSWTRSTHLQRNVFNVCIKQVELTFDVISTVTTVLFCLLFMLSLADCLRLSPPRILYLYPAGSTKLSGITSCVLPWSSTTFFDRNKQRNRQWYKQATHLTLRRIV